MTPLEHWETSQRFIEQAVAEHADGDLLQASEKTWDAVAHAVKAIAERRGWRHDSHRRLFVVIDMIISETGQREIRKLFQAANNSHKNFYEGRMDSRDVEDNIMEVENLLAILDAVGL